MLFESSRQLPLIALFSALGYCLGAVYDILFILRMGSRAEKVIADIIFCAVFCVGFGAFALIFNFGSVKFYMFLSLLPGFLCERYFLGNFIKKVMDFLRKIIYNLYTVSCKVVKFVLR